MNSPLISLTPPNSLYPIKFGDLIWLFDLVTKSFLSELSYLNCPTRSVRVRLDHSLVQPKTSAFNPTSNFFGKWGFRDDEGPFVNNLFGTTATYTRQIVKKAMCSKEPWGIGANRADSRQISWTVSLTQQATPVKFKVNANSFSSFYAILKCNSPVKTRGKIFGCFFFGQLKWFESNQPFDQESISERKTEKPVKILKREPQVWLVCGKVCGQTKERVVFKLINLGNSSLVNSFDQFD